MGVRITGPEFDAEEESFRRSRRLLSGDELVSWLSRRDIEVTAWRDYIRGVVLARYWPTAPASPPAGAEGDLGTAVWVYAICSGTLDAVAHQLAARVAVACAVDRGEVDGPLTRSEVEELDSVFIEFCERSATLNAIEREVERHRLDWLRIELRSGAAADQEVLREAALCIREDGLDFDDVAAAAGLTVQTRRTDLEGLQAELRGHLLGARVGELLGPLAVGSEYWLVEVLDKRVPSSDDPEMRARARDAVVSRAVEAEVIDRVRWDEHL